MTEIADSAVPVYTVDRWATFTDLGAWQEDIEDLASGTGAVALTDLAGLALFVIADRVAGATYAALVAGE